jgi:[protein-PII] uridylyltransferase
MGFQGSANAMAGAPEKFQSSPPWRTIEDAFHHTGDASAVLTGLTAATDDIVRQAYASSIGRALPRAAAMFAVGAYGRSETFPYSGADIVILVDNVSDSDALRDAKGAFARVLWDAGLRLNYSVRTLAECVDIREQSLELAISLLDRRFLDGDADLRARLEDRLPAALNRAAKKIALRLVHSARARHAKFGHTAQHLEPDVKEAPGGLRDLRIVDWLAKLFPDLDPDPALSGAGRALAVARCFLHYRAGRDVNLLDAAAQSDLAAPPYSLSTPDYFRAARLVRNETRRAVETVERSNSSLLDNFREYRTRLSNAEFTVARDRVLLRSPGHLETDPELLLRFLEFIGRHGIPPAPETERRLERCREPLTAWFAQPRPLWPALKSILAAPHAALALRTLHQTGLAAAVLPGWDDVRDLPVAKPGRAFTADEHALRSLEAIASLISASEAGAQRFATVISEIDQPAVLALALLFADAGPARARTAAAHVQMPDDDAGTLLFLVENQEELNASLSRDIDDPAATAQLAHRVGTVEHLRLLAILTYAGIAAADAEAASPYRLERLWKIYTAVRQELTRELETERIEEPPAELPEVAEFIQGFPSRYVRAHTAPEIAAQYSLYERSRPTGVAADLDPIEGGYRLAVVARDRPYLFASFAAAISSFGLDILKAEAFSNTRGVILDTFVFADPRRLLQLNPSEVERLKDLVHRVALGKTDAQRLLRGATLPDAKKRPVAPEVRFDSTACDSATLVEIVTDDRPGLLYSLATVFSSNSCNIDVVLIDTKGRRAIDVFYVAYGGRKLSDDMESRLREKLLAAC